MCFRIFFDHAGNPDSPGLSRTQSDFLVVEGVEIRALFVRKDPLRDGFSHDFQQIGDEVTLELLSRLNQLLAAVPF